MSSTVTVAGVRKDPAVYGVYLASVSLQVGVVAANNFFSLFNPVGSGKFLSLGGFFFSSYGIGSTTASEPMRGFRITDASGGAAFTDIAKFDSRYRDPVAEVRTTNPTVTLGPPIFNSPPPLGTGGIGTQFVHAVDIPPGAGSFTLLPGEGVVARTASGDVDQFWNITCVWGEGPA